MQKKKKSNQKKGNKNRGFSQEMQKDHLLHTEGIVLSATPFKEYDKILTLFTKEHGLLKLFVKGSKKRISELATITTPLTRGEYLYQKGSFAKLFEGKAIDGHLLIRNSLATLESAMKISAALLKSQEVGKAAPKLYALFSHFLEKLSGSSAPETLFAAFLLKILKHDGWFQKEQKCSFCGKPLSKTWRYGGELFCSTHAYEGSLTFSEEEEKILFFLAECRLFSKMSSFSLEKSLIGKIASLFEQAIAT